MYFVGGRGFPLSQRSFLYNVNPHISFGPEFQIFPGVSLYILCYRYRVNQKEKWKLISWQMNIRSVKPLKI